MAALDPKAVRKKILADPNTAKIADTLQIPLEDYVDQVVEYVLNPKKDPDLVVIKDDDLKKLGLFAPNPREMANYLDDHLEAAEVSEVTDFTPAKKPKVTLSGANEMPAVQAPTHGKSGQQKAAAKPENKALKDAVKKNRGTGKL